jgi:23S rRNA (adenine2503-C2)-methyltransferase
VLYLVDPSELQTVLDGEPSFRADQLREWLYRNPVTTTEQMTNLPSALRDRLDADLWPFSVEVEQSADAGTTRKWLFRADDGAAYEAVLMGYPDRVTLCLSSQAGCALGCTFCATGQFGFERHLDAGEIVAQVAWARASLAEHPMPGVPSRLSNIVFMGMGEPLANYRRVREGIRRIIEEMDRLAEEPWPLKLAVSLHAADDELRSQLIPLNDRYPLAEVERAAADYARRKRRRISIEWTMMDGVNDSDEQADGLAEIARRLRAHVNLIAMNPTPLSEERPTGTARIERFAERLRDAGVNTTIRDTRGTDIDAACGQLRVREG